MTFGGGAGDLDSLVGQGVENVCHFLPSVKARPEGIVGALGVHLGAVVANLGDGATVGEAPFAPVVGGSAEHFGRHRLAVQGEGEGGHLGDRDFVGSLALACLAVCRALGVHQVCQRLGGDLGSILDLAHWVSLSVGGVVSPL